LAHSGWVECIFEIGIFTYQAQTDHRTQSMEERDNIGPP
jgi:hypothetical protein